MVYKELNDFVMIFCVHKHLKRNLRIWEILFEKIVELSVVDFTHIDTNDPLRNKVASAKEASNYFSHLLPIKHDLWVFGKIGKPKKIDLMINLSNNEGENAFPDYIHLSFSRLDINKEKDILYLNNIFIEISKIIKPFYAICDLSKYISQKKNEKGGSVNIQEELIGVFWLTFFNNKYSEFLEIREKGIDDCIIEELDGNLIKLGETPLNLILYRAEAEEKIGKIFFVDPKFILNKSIGKYALSFKEV